LSNIDPQLPFIDLHRHLDGNVRLETILDLGRQHNLSLPAWEIEELRPYIQVTEPKPGVMAFIERFHWMTQILVDYEACRRIAYENVEDARTEGLDYVELRFSPSFMASAHQLDPIRVVQAVCEGIQAGRSDFGQKVNLIGIISRTYGVDAGWEELQALLAFSSHLAAIDLAGDEAKFPARMFSEHFKHVREAELGVTVHAGESAGPESIWQAVQDLGATRIGHAVSALQDPILTEYMQKNRIAIECNLTSNVQTSTVMDYPSHPLRQFIDLGLLATINTDDPGISGIDLAYEYDTAAPAAGLSMQQIRAAQRNAVEAAFLSEDQKGELYSRKQIP
jgi:adenosine deaminase